MNDSEEPSSADNPESIWDSIVEEEALHNLEDPEELEYEMLNSVHDEDVDDYGLTPEERYYFDEQSHRLPPVPEGKMVSPAMINFVRGVTKAYRLCFFQFMNFVDNAQDLIPDLLGYCNRRNIDAFFERVISRRTTSVAVNRRYVSAIQKFSDKWEERTGLVVESPVVKKALSDAIICRK